MKKFFSEFLTFIKRGNVLDMAVGVIVGSAFTAIVTALSNGILKPLINWVLALVGGDSNALESAYTILKPTYTVNEAGEKILDLANSVYIDWGAFLSAIINFILIAFVVFCIVKAINKARELADVDAMMTEKVQKKLDADEKLSDAEEKWLKRYTKRYPDKAPKKTEVVVEEPVVEEPTKTEKLLEDILNELKANTENKG
ncbi:MAG TPA: large conductance mechanosensitive channel protein MscL [Clostridiales bacterium]|nr:large conductance mechanosensitive channel protein MscL [Clostridiales bacterium]